MKKITFVIPALGSGGAERVVSTLAAELDRWGYGVSIILVITRDQVYPLPDTVRLVYLDAIADQELPLWKRWPLRLKKLARAVRETEPDVVVSFMAETNIDVCMALAGTGIPVVVSERNDPRLEPAGRFKQLLRRIVYHRAQGFVFQTPDARDYFAPWIRRKGTIILNPLIGKLPQSYDGPREKRVAAVGRLNDQKNYPLLLAAFRDFSEKHPDYTLEIYGKGYLEDSIRQQITELGLEGRVTLMGFCADVHRAIRQAAFFVMSSDFEGLPNALIEAMALGLPCICTDCPCGGPRLLINSGGGGLLTPVGDAAALTRAMEFLAEHPQEAARLGRQAAGIRQQVAVDAITDQWVAYLEACL